MDEFSDSFAAFRDVLFRDKSWASRISDFLYTAPVGAGPMWAFHVFNSINVASSSASPVSTYLAHMGGATTKTGTATVYRLDTNAAVTVNGVNLATTDPHELIFATINNRCFIAGRTLTGGSVPTIVTRFPTQTSYPWGKAGPINDLTYTAFTNPPTGTADDATKQYFRSGSAGTGLTNTGTNAWSASAWFDASGLWDGKTLIADNDVLNPYVINDVVTTSAMTTTSNGVGETDVDTLIRYGNLSWGVVPPKYAYAYYNPTTGHLTNLSPPLQLSEKNMSNVGVEISGIQLDNDSNYTKIVLFRSFDDGADLYPLKLDSGHGGSASIDADGFINNGPVGTVTYRDNKTTGLGEVLGRTKGPLFVNDPPPADIKYFNFWDGRIWLTTVSNPGRLQYSRVTNPGELGVGEESFPPDNYIDTPSDDGMITGFHVIGTSNIVCTDKYLYYIAGGGGQYGMVRFSARGSGVNHFAIDEHPGDTTTESASAIYVSRDNRLWRHYLNGRLDDLGAPIQDKLDAVVSNSSRPFLVDVMQFGKNWFCALGIRGTSGGVDYYDTYFFDFDSMAWLDLGYTFDSFRPWCLISGIDFSTQSSGISVAAIGKNDLASMNVLGTGAGLTATVDIMQHLDFGDPVGKKSLQSIEYYVNDVTNAGTGWACGVRFDGDVSGGFTALTRLTTAGTPREAGAGIIRWTPDGASLPKQWHSIQIRRQYNAAGFAQAPARIYRMVINYTTETTGASGRP